MTDINRIKDSLKFLKDNQRFKVGGLYLSAKGTEIEIIGQTNYNDIKNINKKIARKDLESIKAEFMAYRNMVKEFDDFFKDKKIKYSLIYDYGMGGLELCNALNEEITWTYEFND